MCRSAGYAGLTAARRLAQGGRTVAVLEARGRVGGRIWTERRSGDLAVDRGGAWFAPSHDAIFALAGEVGVTTYKTWVSGEHLLIGDGQTRRYKGLIPKISPRAVLTIALAQARLLASFTFGRVAERFDALDPGDRRRAVIEALTARFGNDAADPLDYVETPWWNEPWSRGCSMAHWPPGVLTAHGPLLRQPFGRVHWAGTETATVSHGAIDGAVRSGQRAATEILDRD